MKSKYLIAVCSLIALTLIISSAKKNEEEEQEEVMSQAGKVVAVPIPSEINFAGEKVPLDRYQVRERLDRELLVNSYWQSMAQFLPDQAT